MLDFSPRLRDALTREFLIRERIAHAKPRRGSGRRRGSERGRMILDFGCLILDWRRAKGWSSVPVLWFGGGKMERVRQRVFMV